MRNFAMRNAACLLVLLCTIPAITTARPNEANALTVHMVQTAFQPLTNATTASQFFDNYVADDVLWTVMGVNYLAGTTRGKAKFVSEDVGKLREFLTSNIEMVIDNIHVAGNNTAIVEMRSTAWLKSGAPYQMTYIWVVGFSKSLQRIEWIRAYIDTEVLNAIFRENEQLPNVFVTCEIEPSAGKWEEVGEVLRGLKKYSRVAEAGLEGFQILADNKTNRYRFVAEFANDYTTARYLGATFFRDALTRLGQLSDKPVVTTRYIDAEVDRTPAVATPTGLEKDHSSELKNRAEVPVGTT